MAEISLEEYKNAYREITLEEEKRGFYVHFTVFVLVNTLLILINLLFSPGVLWFIFPLFGWGIGLAFHFLGAFYFEKINLIDREARAEYRVHAKHTSG
jgi:hypothetical protein